MSIGAIIAAPQTSDLDADATRPPLKWVGGKRWLLPYIQPIWSTFQNRRLVEPFCGGLSVALGMRPQRALLNDVNKHVINFYKWVQRGLRIDFPLKNDSDLYYTYRDRFNQLIRDNDWRSAEAAGLFYYLNRTGYNGLCRFNRNGLFNVPFGKYSSINYRRDFTHLSQILKAWEFVSGDFETLQLSDGDFVYADPPYDVEFRQYAQDGFSWSDQVRLAHWLSSHRGPVVLSNQATERIIELYLDLGFELRFLEAPRLISCNGDRTPALEVLATKGL